MLKIHRFIFNPFEENTYVLVDSQNKSAVVVDPGMWNNHEREAFDRFINDNGINITQIVNTHMHLDHCFGDNYVRDRYGVKINASAGDAYLGKSISEQARRFGLSGMFPSDGVKADVYLEDGDTLKVGDSSLKVIAVPGHSPGGLALYCAKQGFVLTGDSLFEGSIGRTDLDGGDHATLVDAVSRRLLSLPGDTDVFPGHGPQTTISAEALSNPYL